MKLIRFDDVHFGLMLEGKSMISMEKMQALQQFWEEFWPGSRLLILQADEFIDLTGKYEIIPIPEGMAV